MVKVYYNLIKAGVKTIDDVPNIWKKAVEDMLKADM